MTKRLLVALLAGMLALLPLSAAAAEEEPAPEPTLGDIVSAAVADYLQGLDLDEESAEAVAEAVADLVEAIADIAAEAAEEEAEEAEEAQEAEEQEAEEDEEAEDETHGEVVSMVAQCAPNGKLLKGTGLTHGSFVSAVASGEDVVVPALIEGELDAERGDTFTVETVEDAQELCEALEFLALDLEILAEAEAQSAAAEADGDDGEAEESDDDADAPGKSGKDKAKDARGKKGD